MSRYPYWLILVTLFWFGIGVIPANSAPQLSPLLSTPSQDLAKNLVDPTMAKRWQPNPDRGTASSTLSGGRQGAVLSVSWTVEL